MSRIDPRIVACYLYPITKYGYPPKAENTLSYIEEFYELNFTSIELEGIREQHLNGVFELRHEICKKLQELHMTVPYFCVVLPGLSSINEKERDTNLNLFRKGCEIASLMGAKGVLDNAPLPPYQFPDDIPVVRHYHEETLQTARLPNSLKWNDYWQILIESYREACDIAAEFGLTYQMHPAYGVLASTTDAFLYFQNSIQRDNLRFNFDTANQFFLRDNLQLSLRRLSEFIDYIHISDNSGQRVEHLAIGDGVIRWDDFFETLDIIGFSGHLGIDIGGAESKVNNLSKAYTDAANFITMKISGRDS
jgi:sugar phosphate isomerase/epimerase